MGSRALRHHNVIIINYASFEDVLEESFLPLRSNNVQPDDSRLVDR